jgi:hypothetical protein
MNSHDFHVMQISTTTLIKSFDLYISTQNERIKIKQKALSLIGEVALGFEFLVTTERILDILVG